MVEWEKDLIMLRTFNGKTIDSTELVFKNFREIIEQHLTNKTFFLSEYESNRLGLELTFSGFAKRVKNFSYYLFKSIGPKQPIRIAVVMENSAAALVSYSAVMNLGMTLIPLDPQQPREYYEKVAKLFDCHCVITEKNHLAQNAFPTHVQFSDHAYDDCVEIPFFEATPLVIFTSSGTTGRPKGIKQSFNALLVNSIATQRVHQLNKNSKHFCVLPLFHVNAFSFSFFTSLIVGNSLILNKRFVQATFWDCVNRTSPTVISLIPPIIKALNEDPRVIDPPSTLKYVVSAATNLGKKTLLTFYQRFKVPVIQAYGLSETVNFTTTFPTESLLTGSYETILSQEERTSIGVEVWGNNVLLIDAKDQIIDSEMTEGELVVRGWNVMDGYEQSEKETEACFRGDWFHTGDIGYFRNFDSRRFYYLTGRIKEIVKVNGRLFFLNDIDDIVLQIPGVNNVCSISYQDLDYAEQLGICIELQSGLNSGDIKREVRRQLPPSLSSCTILFDKEILLTASGKKRRAEMAKKYFQQA